MERSAHSHTCDTPKTFTHTSPHRTLNTRKFYSQFCDITSFSKVRMRFPWTLSTTYKVAHPQLGWHATHCGCALTCVSYTSPTPAGARRYLGLDVWVGGRDFSRWKSALKAPIQTKKWGLRGLENGEISTQEMYQGTPFGPQNLGSLRFLNKRTAALK